MSALFTSWIGLFHLLNSKFFLISSIFLTLLIFIPPLIKWITDIKNLKPTKLSISIHLIIFLALLSCLAPPFDWDEVAYNLALPLQYLALGHFKYIQNYGFYSAFPLFSDALNTMLLKGTNYVSTHIIGIWSYFSVGLITYYICKLLKIRSLFCFLAAVLALASPSIYSLAPTSKPDNLITTYILLSFYLLLASLESNNKTKKIANYFISVTFMSLAIGFKYSAVYLLPAYFLIFFYAILKKKSGNNLKKIILILLGGFLIFLGINIVWLIRNFLETGNPIYPILNFFLHDNLTYHFTIYRSMLLKEFLISMKDMSFHQSHSIFAFLKNIKNQTFLIPYLFLPFFVKRYLFCRSDSNIIFILTLATLITFLEFFFFLPWETRHIPGLNILIFILFSHFLNSVVANNIYKKIVFICYIVFALTLFSKSIILLKNYPVTCFSLNTENSLACGMKKATFGKVAEYLNTKLEKNDKVALNVMPFFYLKVKYLFIFPWVELPNILQSDSPEEMLRKLEKDNITHIAWWNNGFSYKTWFDPKKGPNLTKWFSNMDKNIFILVEKKAIIEINEIDGIKIYKISKY